MKLPSWSDAKGWTGGDDRTLFAFTDNLTGRVTVYPNYNVHVGPNATVRVATRDEAERLWQSPLHSGWRVVEAAA